MGPVPSRRLANAAFARCRAPLSMNGTVRPSLDIDGASSFLATATLRDSTILATRRALAASISARRSARIFSPLASVLTWSYAGCDAPGGPPQLAAMEGLMASRRARCLSRLRSRSRCADGMFSVGSA